MSHLNVEKVSLASRNREKEEQAKNQRKKVLLVLINHFLEENGLKETADVLKSETNFVVNDYTVCDNIHFESVLQDFESYHFLRYQKLPQIIRKLPQDKKSISSSVKSKSAILKRASKSICSSVRCNSDFEKHFFNEYQLNNDCFQNKSKLDSNAACVDAFPLGLFENHSSEWCHLANIILQDFRKVDKTVLWSDVVGHERAKQILKEAIIYPIQFKELFNTFVVPWKSMLLYGPTGTGKTLLATAISSESKVAFFNVSVSSITSKWRGESEKLVKVLFDLANYYAPSIIFIDEIDSLMSLRGNDHEASRRVKTEFFCQIDTILSTNKDIFLLGATNLPWELDHAILRRFEKRLLIDLPDFESRILLFKKLLPLNLKISNDTTLKSNLKYEELATASENYSASDIQLACKEAKMNLIREIFPKINEIPNGKNLFKLINLEILKTSDVLFSLSNTRESVTNLSEKYLDWKEKYGSE